MGPASTNTNVSVLALTFGQLQGYLQCGKSHTQDNLNTVYMSVWPTQKITTTVDMVRSTNCSYYKPVYICLLRNTAKNKRISLLKLIFVLETDYQTLIITNSPLTDNHNTNYRIKSKYLHFFSSLSALNILCGIKLFLYEIK